MRATLSVFACVVCCSGAMQSPPSNTVVTHAAVRALATDRTLVGKVVATTGWIVVKDASVVVAETPEEGSPRVDLSASFDLRSYDHHVVEVVGVLKQTPKLTIDVRQISHFTP